MSDLIKIEFANEVEGIYFRSHFIEKPFVLFPAHLHDHGHATYIGSGKLRVWVDGEHTGDFEAGQAIPVAANKKHHFQTLEPNTRFTCVHDAQSAMSVKEKGI